MRYRRLNVGSPEVSVVGQGTWNMELDDREAAIAALRAGLDAGANHIDTAEMYGSGRVESLVGEAIAGRRDEVFLVSKVLPHNASRQGTVRACEASLKRLGIDHLDLYLLHWPGSHPLQDTIEAFEQLVRQGKIRQWGLSNFDVDELDQALRLAGPGKIACNQVLYHLKERAIEARVLPWCIEHDVALVAYSPLGSGDFASPQSRGGRVLHEIAKRHDATPQQVALAFLLVAGGEDGNAFVIPKSANVEHTHDNVAAANLELSAQDLERLDQVFPRKPAHGLPML